ncbi:LOW QUALITY PROTEIN: hypothetical protein HID58_043492, partial [Brassica napus]
DKVAANNASAALGSVLLTAVGSGPASTLFLYIRTTSLIGWLQIWVQSEDLVILWILVASARMEMFWVQGRRIPWVVGINPLDLSSFRLSLLLPFISCLRPFLGCFDAADDLYMTKSALMWVFNSSIGIGEAVSLTDSNELMEVAGFEAMREWPLRVFGFGLRTVLCVFLI